MHRYRISSALAAVVTFGTFLIAASSQAGQYEGAPTFSAAQTIQSAPLHGADYVISDRLRVRLREITATEKLEEVNGAETAVKSAGRTALAPLNTAKDLVTRPAQTIGDTARGVGNIFGTARATMNATDPHGDRIIASVTGGASARRKQAFNLGVDRNMNY